jgi:hypothetical protein
LNTAFTISLIRKTGSVETIIHQITNGTNTGNNTAYILTTITQCSVGDEVYGYVNSGSLRLNSSPLLRLLILLLLAVVVLVIKKI